MKDYKIRAFEEVQSFHEKDLLNKDSPFITKPLLIEHKSKIYDCFLYYNEERILLLRLETLYDHVDYFIIVESARTFTGALRNLTFKMENFLKYQDKIKYLVFENTNYSENAWENESY
jgi:hypothetical protein